MAQKVSSLIEDRSHLGTNRNSAVDEVIVKQRPSLSKLKIKRTAKVKARSTGRRRKRQRPKVSYQIQNLIDSESI